MTVISFADYFDIYIVI